MKILLSILSVTLFISSVHAQTSHIVVAFDFGFSPQNLTIFPGDTVYFESVGYHSMTEVSEEDWNNNVANSNGGFWVGFEAPTMDIWFVVHETGVYHYICVPHAAMGMKGTLEVMDPTVGIAAENESNPFSIQPSGGGQFSLNFLDCDEFVVISTSGQRQLSKSLRGMNNGQAFFNFGELAEGAYLGIFMKNSEGVSVVKFIR